MKPILFTVFITLLTYTLAPLPALSATIHVPADQPTIQKGIRNSVSGDLVLVAPGTYFENIDFFAKLITLQSEAGSEVTVIDGNQTGSTVTFDSGELENTVLQGFTIRNGSGTYETEFGRYYGGGIYCYMSRPTIINCIIEKNNARYGGGVFCESASPTISNCTISENGVPIESYGLGGGIYCRDSSYPTIEYCIISKNMADGGGGMDFYGSQATITNCRVIENIAGSGGGIKNSGGVLNISNCTILENTSTVGGGIYCSPSPSTIAKCIIAGNYADRGGGIYCVGGPSHENHMKITNCNIIRNTADKGAGIYCNYTSPEVTNCTISDNTATYRGGGIYCDLEYEPMVVENCILWNDIAPEGPEIYRNSWWLMVTYSDVEGGWEGFGNIDEDPCFLGGGNYHLHGGSPCIDTGWRYVEVDSDIDGDERPQFTEFDMGADEYTGSCWDMDGDGYLDQACGGDDCDDTAWISYPGATELCDGMDNNCDGTISDDEADMDSDGWMICEGDCDDIEPEVNPAVSENCSNSIDDDCDGLIDSVDPDCICFDLDGDGYGDPGSSVCPFAELDCDDTDPLVYPWYPESTQMGNCDDGKDNDCDGSTDMADDKCKPPCSTITMPKSLNNFSFFMIPLLVILFLSRRVFLQRFSK